MNIGITTFGADAGRSGIGRYAREMISRLPVASTDHHFDVLAHASERDGLLGAHAPVDAVAIAERFRPALKNVLWHQTHLPALARARRHDVLLLTAANRRVPWRAPCPTVGVVHDLSSLHVADKYDRAHLFYIRHVLPALVRRLTHVITVSESSKQDITRYARVPEDRVSVIPLAADHALFTPGDRAAATAAMARIGIQAPYVLNVSRLEHPGKNHVRLIDAFSAMKAATGLPHRLVLAGPDAERAAEIRAHAAASPFAHDIVFTGFIDGAALPDLFRAADVFAFPSLYEGFGLPVLEAMACGTPVMCSTTSSLGEVGGNAAVGCDPCDVRGMAAALQQLLTDDGHHTRVRTAGLARCQDYHWDRTTTATLRILEQAHEDHIRTTPRRA
ncbi:MAG: glycosyltransferase family 1 protein [Acidobacteriota bacterium]